MPFRHFLYFFPRLSTLLILTILRHLSLKPGHIAHFNTLYALHVPQTRTHSALQRHICPICPSAPDTWRTSTPYMPYMSLKPGHMAHFNGVSAPHVPQPRTHEALERWRKYTKALRLREAEEKAATDESGQTAQRHETPSRAGNRPKTGTAADKTSSRAGNTVKSGTGRKVRKGRKGRKVRKGRKGRKVRKGRKGRKGRKKRKVRKDVKN